MSDILERLAAITENHKQFGSLNNRELALIALVREMAGEIERFRAALAEISKHQEYGGYGSGLNYTRGAQIARSALDRQEPDHA